MKAITLFENKCVLSFEVFPPKPTTPIERIYETLNELQSLRPDFISVTYGAGGSTPGASTCEICATVQNQHGILSMAHLPCINDTKEGIKEKLSQFKENGIKNVLALRGDRNPDIEPKNAFHYACELVNFIREHGDFDICGACYPEGHPEAADPFDDVRHLKEKVDAGVSHLITQLFLDNRSFYRFRELTAVAGIQVPIEAGIMPVTNKKSIERMVTMCGASMPARLSRLLARYADDPPSLKAAGLEYAIEQILDLIKNGVDGIHLYTMNNPDVAKYIVSAIGDEMKR
ncbi:MAG: methylenetetrahydrofolate reductase [NAD(P)H] [Oscillospiraceae bacterium]|nr:methylenetetrahydrofolate reductase [NAD(P)H] [Oscillospiraceae bacterium]